MSCPYCCNADCTCGSVPIAVVREVDEYREQVEYELLTEASDGE